MGEAMSIKDKVKKSFFYKSFRKMQNNKGLLSESLGDYRNYSKYNFGNSFCKTEGSLDGRIIRQTHILEKGMSLEHPRKGFGQKKIEDLLIYIREYQSLGFDMSRFSVVNALNTLDAYVEFQKKLGCSCEKLEKELEPFRVYMNEDLESGICKIQKEELEKQIQGEFPEFFRSRHSIRQFAKKPVEVEIIKEAVALAMKAPSACNRQSPKVYYFKDREKNKEISSFIAGNTGFEEDADKYLIVTADISSYTNAYERNQPYVDGALFAMSLALSLHYYGIGSCFLQAGEIRKKIDGVKKAAQIPENEVVVLFMAIGYYKDEFDAACSARKPLEDVLIVK